MLRALSVMVKVGVASAVLGALTTVGVAWGLAAWLPDRQMGATLTMVNSGPDLLQTTLGIDQFQRPGMCRRQSYILGSGCFIYNGELAADWDTSGPLGMPSGWQHPIHDASRLAGWGTLHDRSVGFARSGWMADHRSLDVIEDARGFPRLAFWCRLSGPPVSGEFVAGGPAGCFMLSPPGARPGDMRALPYVPIWSGIAFNTGVYAAAWAVVLPMPWAVRRVARRRRGHCPRCGYDLLRYFSGGCPECAWGREPRSRVSG